MERIDGRSINHEALEHIRMNAVASVVQRRQHPVLVAEVLGFSRTVIYGWLKKYHLQGWEGLRLRRATGRPPKINRRRILTIVSRPATDFGFPVDLWNSPRLRVILKHETGILYHPVTIQRILAKEGYSFQKPEAQAYEQNLSLVKEWKERLWPRIEEYARKNNAVIYFEDESGLRTNHTSGKTWAPKGETPTRLRSGKRESINLLSAVTKGGKLVFSVSKNRINAKVFIQFLSRLLRYHPNRKVVVIVDRSRAHTANLTKEFIKSQKRLSVILLPPYSPKLNPDEFVWGHLKKHGIGQQLVTCGAELSELARRHLRSLQRRPDLIRSFVHHVLSS